MAKGEDACPVRLTGLELRSTCERCRGRPETGQRVLRPGELLVLEGDRAENLHPVIEGLLEESLTLPDGRAVSLRLLGPGDVVGTEALVRDEYASTVTALTEARVCVVGRRTADAHVGSRPEQTVALRRRLEDNVQALRDRLVQNATMSADARVLEVLRVLGRNFAPGAWFRPALSRKAIAEHLGLAPETVTRVMKRLEAGGELETRGRDIRLARSTET